MSTLGVAIPHFRIAEMTLPLLVCKINNDVRSTLEKILGSRLLGLYNKVLTEALKCEISNILNAEYLNEDEFSRNLLRFSYRLADPEICCEAINIIERISKLNREDLRVIYTEALCHLTEKIRSTGYRYMEDVVYAISILLERDLWIVSKTRSLSLDGFITKLINKACREVLEFVDYTVKLTFTIVSMLAALFNNVKFRRENLDKLADWSRDFAEHLSSCINTIDAQLIGEADPQLEVEQHLETAENFLGEAKRLIEMAVQTSEQIYIMQASEKLYKVAEECIKALAIKYNVKELEKVKVKGKWDTWLLGQAAASLAEILGEKQIETAWKYAYDIHVWGFHERKYSIREIQHAQPDIEWLLNYAKKKLKES